jgi:hypothetical protein
MHAVLSGAARPVPDRALIACSLWLHVAYIGAATMAVGFIKALDDSAGLVPSAGLAFCGAALAAGAWARARNAIGKAGRP